MEAFEGKIMAKKKKDVVKFDYEIGTLLVIEWVDIASYDDWHDQEDAKELPTVNATSVGWFINSDNDVIRITSTVADNAHNVLVIPKSVVKKIVADEAE